MEAVPTNCDSSLCASCWGLGSTGCDGLGLLVGMIPTCVKQLKIVCLVTIAPASLTK